MIGKVVGGKWHRVKLGDVGALNPGWVYLACTGRNAEVRNTFESQEEYEKTTGSTIRSRDICQHRPCRYERKANK